MSIFDGQVVIYYNISFSEKENRSITIISAIYCFSLLDTPIAFTKTSLNSINTFSLCTSEMNRHSHLGACRTMVVIFALLAACCVPSTWRIDTFWHFYSVI